MPRRRRLDTARSVTARALAEAAERFPDMPPIEPDCERLTPADTRLAIAVHRTALQRWLTLRHLLDRYLRKKMQRLEPALQGVLLSGAAQLVLMDRLPVYAVVDETVALARSMVRPGAAGLVNAVMRRLANVAGSVMRDMPWRPAANRLPLEQGSVALSEDALPDPNDVVTHLSTATSHPKRLVEAWLEQYGYEQALALLTHSLKTPPVFVVEGKGEPRLWEDSHEALTAYLTADPRRRVQDPTAAGVVTATRDLQPKTILDRCAGRGTKTRQLAALHPDAEIVACDPHAERFAELRKLADQLDRVTAAPAEKLAGRRFDLVMLDVPCSNAGVFARRPEARYRYAPRHLASISALQRKIVEQAAELVAPGGAVLYATCSIEPLENRKQAEVLARLTGGEVACDQLTLPGGSGANYHDGGYHALIRVA